MWLLSLGMADDDWDLIKLPPLWVSSVCSSAGMALKSWRSFTSPASPKSSSSNSRGGVRLLPLPTLLRGRPRMLTDLFPRLHAPNDGKRKQKKQQQKVVCHGPSDGLSSDVWAWRKYGQKPIKGSPYPR
ncbi:hypothetical protein C4D60_Mb10t27240 [Musa balbisiana]|uniref:WRKY domain-containing protein n=1 Tax=Musa balbisiana TaxID=52838 RepID=A0A4V4H545_MUSBA|nr:hypothetical protein C4D60_Mb10t27240 [Musa balbisiana]